jgi:hypothetical protein
MEVIERKRTGVLNKAGGEFVAGGEVGHGETGEVKGDW